MKRRTADGSRAVHVLAAALAAMLTAALAVPPAASADVSTRPPIADGDDRRPPVADADAAARAFRLFYRERVERAAIAFNRFGMVGDTAMATPIGRVQVKHDGSSYEIVPGPVDNNSIGTSAFNAYQAYRVFRSRTLELTLVRMFEGLSFIEEVTGPDKSLDVVVDA